MDLDEHCEKLLREIGIEDKCEWIHIDDDCPVYEYLTDTDIVKNGLNSSANKFIAKNGGNDNYQNDDPPPSPKKK